MQPGLDDEIELMRQAPNSVEIAVDSNFGELRRESNMAPGHIRRVVSRRADYLAFPRRAEGI